MARLTNTLLLALLAAGTSLAVDKTVDPSLDAQIKEAATNLDRQSLLPDDSDWVFDFTKQPYYTYSPGGVVNANAATFPAATDQGLTLAMLLLGPCAMLPPHYHPRATNFVIAVEGETDTFMIAENGARLVKETLTPGKMTIFPRASLHTMQNTGCGNNTLISALNSDDAGTHNVANGLFNLPPDMVAAAFGNKFSVNTTAAWGAGVPAVGTGAALGSAECLAKCNIKSS